MRTMNIKVRWEIVLTLLALLVTVFTLVFGDNIYQQITGHSFFDVTPEVLTPKPIIGTPTAAPMPPTSICQAIMGKLPNSPQEVRVKFGIPADKGIRLFYEICQEAPNGFIVEESPALFTLQVPQGGCIDSYSGANFSDATVPERLFGGRRAYSGSVTTTSLTYRIAGCELKP